MRVFIVTQEDRLFINEYMNLLLNELKVHHDVVGVGLFSASPFGKKMSIWAKIWQTIQVFGWRFFIHYLVKRIYKQFTSNSVRNICNSKDITVFNVRGDINSEENLAYLRTLEIDLIISFSGNQIFKTELIELPHFGCINLHCSLLPNYRGLFPSFWTLHNAEDYGGASVFLIDEGIDSGPILVQEKLKINKLTQAEVIHATKTIGVKCILKAVDLIQGEEVTFHTNCSKLGSKYSFPTKANVKQFRLNGGKFF